MTDQLPEEVFIVGYRYRDNADDVSKLFKLNRPIEKKDIIEVFGDDSAFLKPVESDIDPYCVAVYDIETKHIGYVWMLQAPTMRRWMETHNEDFISIRITGTIPAANVLLGVMEEPLDVPLTNREFNAFDPSWASNLPGILRGDSEECLDMQLKLLCKELSKAKKWNKIFEKSISNLFKSIPLDLSSYRHNIYMELFVKMRKSEIKEVREKSDEMLKTLLYRGSKEYMKWWTEEWLTEYFRKVSEGHLFKLFEAAHYTLDVVEDLLEKAPANLYHLYKADKIEFVRRLYYYALPKDAYNRLLTLLAVREALLEKGKGAEVPDIIEPINMSAARQSKLDNIIGTLQKGNWKQPASIKNITMLLNTIYGRDLSSLEEGDKSQCEKMWSLVESGRGDRIVTIQANLAGFFSEENLLFGSPKEISNDLFGKNNNQCNNINKGNSQRCSNAFSEVTPFLRKYVDKMIRKV